MALKIDEHCGRTSFEHLIEYGPKQPCYADVARTTQSVSNWWFLAEFENPNALKTCLAMDGTAYNDNKLTVRALTSKEYDDICGLFDITKARTKRMKKDMKGKRLTIILASNVSSRVTSDALYKFFTFPGDPVEVVMDRARKIALIAYDTEEQGVLALACDQAILGPAMVRIELYRPEKHGKELQFLLKVGHTGDLAHVGAQTGYVQISERNAPAIPTGPPGPATNHPQALAQGPQAHPAPSMHKYPVGYPPGYPPASAGKPDHISTHYNPQIAPVPQRAYAAPSGASGNAGNPFSLSPQKPQPAPHTAAAAPALPPTGARTPPPHPNPYASGSQAPPQTSPVANAYPPQPHQAPSGRPENQQDWSKLVPTAKYTVTTTSETQQ